MSGGVSLGHSILRSPGYCPLPTRVLVSAFSRNSPNRTLTSAQTSLSLDQPLTSRQLKVPCRSDRAKSLKYSSKSRLPSAAIKQDGISSIVVRASEWCPDGSSNDASCYEHRLEALKTVYPNEYGPPEEKGVIREADLEINAVDMKWSSDGSVTGTHSLRATIAHELGHVLGLDDACNTPNTLLARGNRAGLAPLCTSQDVRTSIMYPDPNVSSRPSVLKPGTSEVDFLCESYAAGSKSR